MEMDAKDTKKTVNEVVIHFYYIMHYIPEAKIRMIVICIIKIHDVLFLRK